MRGLFVFFFINWVDGEVDWWFHSGDKRPWFNPSTTTATPNKNERASGCATSLLAVLKLINRIIHKIADKMSKKKSKRQTPH